VKQNNCKILSDFADSSTLDWEIYMSALMFAYNTSLHCSIQANAPQKAIINQRFLRGGYTTWLTKAF
jgi:hypothetical protein